jgi:hypothetical protein
MDADDDVYSHADVDYDANTNADTNVDAGANCNPDTQANGYTPGPGDFGMAVPDLFAFDDAMLTFANADAISIAIGAAMSHWYKFAEVMMPVQYLEEALKLVEQRRAELEEDIELLTGIPGQVEVHFHDTMKDPHKLAHAAVRIGWKMRRAWSDRKLVVVSHPNSRMRIYLGYPMGRAAPIEQTCAWAERKLRSL